MNRANSKVLPKEIEGVTPLHLAIFCGYEDIAEELIKAGADINRTLLDTSLVELAEIWGCNTVANLLQHD